MALLALLAGLSRTLLPADLSPEGARYVLVSRVRLPGTPGKKLALWIPYPADDRHQDVRYARVQSPLPWRFTREKTHGNRMFYVSGELPAGGGEAVVRYVLVRRPVAAGSEVTLAPGEAAGARLYLDPDRLVPLEGPIRERARELADGLQSEVWKARAIYGYVVGNMSYDKQGEGWGRGDALWACEARRGNCTDFHSVLIGMTRCSGVPARFLMGVSLPLSVSSGRVTGYHCWAEFFDRRRGWTPVDASEARKTGLIDDYFGSLPADRIHLTTGRDLVLEPPQEGPPLNFMAGPYAEVAGEPLDALQVETYFARLGE